MAETERMVEAAGEDVEAAIAAGLAELAVGRDEVDVEVLDEGSRGMFGIGSREARVRLVVQAGRATGVQDATAAPARPEDETTAAREVLLELLALMGMERARVSVRQAEGEPGERELPLVFDVQGPDTDLLIGRRGKTLAALQYITRLIVGQELGSHTNVIVDVEGFRARRAKSLQKLAQRMAEQATRTNRRVVLEPMPPHERRAIHVALRGHPTVVTESIGEGERRKVTIIPRHE